MAEPSGNTYGSTYPNTSLGEAPPGDTLGEDTTNTEAQRAMGNVAPPSSKVSAPQVPTGPFPPTPQIPQTPGDLPDTAAATAGASDTQAGILTPQAKTPPSTQTDINAILKPYMA